MYLEYFGFREIPFSLTPDPRFIFLTPSHRELMANLHYGIQNGKEIGFDAGWLVMLYFVLLL